MWPLLLLGAAGGTFAWLLLTRPEVERRRPETPPPLVRVVRARPAELTLVVRAHGTVMPRTESELVAEVAGEVV
ncbi:MAG: efflux transporter periplasmic adaptor subunit, partial [Nitrospirae bacterium]